MAGCPSTEDLTASELLEKKSFTLKLDAAACLTTLLLLLSTIWFVEMLFCIKKSEFLDDESVCQKFTEYR